MIDIARRVRVQGTYVFDGDAVLERLEALGVELVDELVGDAESAVSRLVVFVRLCEQTTHRRLHVSYMSPTCPLHVLDYLLCEHVQLHVQQAAMKTTNECL